MIQNGGFATGRFTSQELHEAERRRHQLAQLTQNGRARKPGRRRRWFVPDRWRLYRLASDRT